MPARFSSTGLLWPTILAIVGFSVLVGLGLWQWDRKQWKADVLERLSAAETAPPKAFSAWFDQLKRDARAVAKREGRDCADPVCAPLDLVSEEFDVVRLSARPAEKQPAFVYAPVGGRQTYRAFAYIETDAGPLQVDRGLIEEAELDAFRDAASAGGDSAAVQDPGDMIVLVRHGPGPQFYTPPPDPERAIWYSVPPRQLNGSDNSGALWLQQVRRGAAPPPANGPVPPTLAEMRERIPNRHFEYALTWWGLAAGLALVYLVFAATRLSSRA